MCSCVQAEELHVLKRRRVRIIHSLNFDLVHAKISVVPCCSVVVTIVFVHLVRLSSSVRGDFIAPPQVSELYIDLLCRYNFTGVVEFLKTNENYRVDETLKVIAHP